MTVAIMKLNVADLLLGGFGLTVLARNVLEPNTTPQRPPLTVLAVHPSVRTLSSIFGV